MSSFDLHASIRGRLAFRINQRLQSWEFSNSAILECRINFFFSREVPIQQYLICNICSANIHAYRHTRLAHTYGQIPHSLSWMSYNPLPTFLGIRQLPILLLAASPDRRAIKVLLETKIVRGSSTRNFHPEVTRSELFSHRGLNANSKHVHSLLYSLVMAVVAISRPVLSRLFMPVYLYYKCTSLYHNYPKSPLILSHRS